MHRFTVGHKNELHLFKKYFIIKTRKNLFNHYQYKEIFFLTKCSNISCIVYKHVFKFISIDTFWKISLRHCPQGRLSFFQYANVDEFWHRTQSDFMLACSVNITFRVIDIHVLIKCRHFTRWTIRPISI